MIGPRISVVVPTRNRAQSLLQLLTALGSQDFSDFEVIVVDDGSTDETATILENWQGANRRSLRLAESRGSYAARNRGWKLATGHLIAFTDDDCRPQPGWLSALARAVAGNEATGVQGVTLAQPGEQTPFTHAIEQTRPGPPYRTCNIAYRPAILQQLGGFDESLRWYADNVLGLQALRLGPIVFAADAIVHHPPRTREWRDRRAWRQRFAADVLHRQYLHSLGEERVTPPGKLLPIVLWVARPLVKQTGRHVSYLFRHPWRYALAIGPMFREKRELLGALIEPAPATGRPDESRLTGLSDRPLVCVIVVTRGRAQLLAGTLAALAAQTYQPRAVIVVDHANGDAVRTLVGSYRVRYIGAAGLSLGGARQAGVDAAPGEIIAFTDDDCRPAPNWLEVLVTTLTREPELYGVQGRTEAEAGPVGSHAVRVLSPDPLFQTCNMAYRHAAVLRAGGFDTRFRGWFEDTALAARILRHGPIGFAPNALVIHRAVQRVPLRREQWRILLADEWRLATVYPEHYRRVRGSGYRAAVTVRWLLGSPLKCLARDLKLAPAHPIAYCRLARLLIVERLELLQSLRTGE